MPIWDLKIVLADFSPKRPTLQNTQIVHNGEHERCTVLSKSEAQSDLRSIASLCDYRYFLQKHLSHIWL